MLTIIINKISASLTACDSAYIATQCYVVWSVCMYESVTLAHPAKAVGRNDTPFGRNTRVVPVSNTVQPQEGKIWGSEIRNLQFAAMPSIALPMYFGPSCSALQTAVLLFYHSHTLAQVLEFL